MPGRDFDKKIAGFRKDLELIKRLINLPLVERRRILAEDNARNNLDDRDESIQERRKRAEDLARQYQDAQVMDYVYLGSPVQKKLHEIGFDRALYENTSTNVFGLDQEWNNFIDLLSLSLRRRGGNLNTSKIDIKDRLLNISFKDFMQMEKTGPNLFEAFVKSLKQKYTLFEIKEGEFYKSFNQKLVKHTHIPRRRKEQNLVGIFSDYFFSRADYIDVSDIRDSNFIFEDKLRKVMERLIKIETGTEETSRNRKIFITRAMNTIARALEKQGNNINFKCDDKDVFYEDKLLALNILNFNQSQVGSKLIHLIADTMKAYFTDDELSNSKFIANLRENWDEISKNKALKPFTITFDKFR
ncbi:MAG: hypothetical protein HRT47_13895 [Candidatus Caenarcaniphilales bacterium]|nr:hypothetical protein [Candidatus Caenarcaniphilales bacterium]